MGKGKEVNTHISLCLELNAHFLPVFDPLLQTGFMVRTQGGQSIRSFLCGELGLSPDYIEGRVHTVFLDGKPVDDLDSATVKNGSHLTFSAAMPGLVGVTMRRGSALASFRSTITHREPEQRTKKKEQGTFHVKLLNLMMKDLGPVFLERGIYVRTDLLAEIIGKQSKEFREECKKVLLNEKPVELNSVTSKILSSTDYVHLLVIVAGSKDL